MIMTGQKMTMTEWKKMEKSKKYRNQETIYNGIIFASKKEANRAYELDMLLKAKQIKRWSVQPEFLIEINGVRIAKYRGDFKVEYPDGRVEIEDVKGFRTPVYRLKAKMMKAVYGIDIKEI